MKKIFFWVLVFLCSFSYEKAEASIYHLYFNYDKKTDFLSFDNSKGGMIQVDQSQDMSPVEFYQQLSSGPFVIVFLNFSGDEIVRKNFDPTASDAFVLDAPYYTFAKSVEVFRAGLDSPILSAELSQFSACNQNGICELEKKENLQTCLSDCVGESVQFSEETKKILDQNNGVIKDPKTQQILLNDIKLTPTTSNESQAQTNADQKGGISIAGIISFVVAIIAVVGGIIFLWRHKDYR